MFFEWVSLEIAQHFAFKMSQDSWPILKISCCIYFLSILYSEVYMAFYCSLCIFLHFAVSVPLYTFIFSLVYSLLLKCYNFYSFATFCINYLWGLLLWVSIVYLFLMIFSIFLSHLSYKTVSFLSTVCFIFATFMVTCISAYSNTN